MMKLGVCRPKTLAIIVLGSLQVGPSAQAAALNFQCTNSVSGATWTVNVDDQKRTVDGGPADISAARISWRDPETGGTYDLNRKSGDLTYVNSSSTGGYMLFHRCKQE